MANKVKDFKNMMTLNNPLNETEKILLDWLNNEPIHVDKLAQSARLDISIVNSTLTVMEMKGMVKHLGNQKYVKAR